MSPLKSFGVLFLLLYSFHLVEPSDTRNISDIREKELVKTLAEIRNIFKYFFETEYRPSPIVEPEPEQDYMNEPTVHAEPDYNYLFGDLEFPLEPPPTTPANVTFKFSPVTLDQAWTKLERLLFLVCCAFFGSILNGFFVASFFVERTLKKAGNAFLACLGLSDLLLTGGVISAAAVVLLSGEWDIIPVCHALYFSTMTSVYSSSMLYLFTALETYARLHFTTNLYEWLLTLRIGLIAGCIYFLSAVLAGVGVYMELDVDYCQRLHHGNENWRIITGTLLHLVPATITMICLTLSAVGINRRARRQPTYKRSQQYERDLSTNNSNIVAFILYVAFWAPYVYVSYRYPKATNYRFYYCAWLGMFRSVITSVCYCLCGSSFKRAFLQLFDYCCCKGSLTNSLNRQRRDVDFKPTTGEVRVHIMHTAMGVPPPQRSTSAAREMQEL